MSLGNKIAFAIVGAVTAAVADKVLSGTWTRLTGNKPPSLSDPEEPVARTLAWIGLSGLVMAGTQIFLNRLGENRWQAKPKPLVVEIGKNKRK
ncbi:MAG: DUF4235 domain-containing protein [Propionibacteriaceae bacterium]|nr:DUF4235 domain-containing protein [Propionibacteriaceae bacterium]